MAYLTGLLGFILFFIYDYNSYHWRRDWGKWFFSIGNGCVALATVLMVYEQLHYVNNHPAQLLIGIAMAIGFFTLLMYTLFFALPFELTYVEQKDGLPVVNSGVYALCRHPGFLWFFGAYSALALVFPTVPMLLFSVLLTGLNLLYIIYQDIVVFPQTISGYDAYKNKTPFLVPTSVSIKACFSLVND